MRLASLLVLPIAAIALTSCASISVDNARESARQNRPSLVYVMNFSTVRADFDVDRTGADLTEFKKNLQLMLRTGLVAGIADKLVPAVAETKLGNHREPDAWLVRGEFTIVKQGSRLLRSAIGFGAGGTKLETRVQVYDLAQDPSAPFLTFSTTGGSNAEPGAILALTSDPFQIAIGGVSGAAHGLSEDTARTAREITAELSDYMYARGWISADQRVEPKHEKATDTW
ncbi:MAG TPA: DUF4410 domain-containing protein [Candidatus Methylacidiphilales bacterium]|jgi:hypothetical protein|nr:DUF4410 domain-containing protein [Candidatus Methylacidiphilales bacterium]